MTTALDTPKHLEFISTLPADQRAVVTSLIVLHNKYDVDIPTDITGYGEWATAYCTSLNHHPTCSAKTRTRRLMQTHQLAHHFGTSIVFATAHDLARAWDELFVPVPDDV